MDCEGSTKSVEQNKEEEEEKVSLVEGGGLGRVRWKGGERGRDGGLIAASPAVGG